jgi:hypothetical protein
MLFSFAHFFIVSSMLGMRTYRGRRFCGDFPSSAFLEAVLELKGKPLSLGAKILGAIIAIGALVLKATISPTLDIDAALKVAAFVVLVFAPVDVSMVMGNIFNHRHGGGQ